MSKQAVVWSQFNCPYCDMAKTLLQLRGWTIEEKIIGDNVTKLDFIEANPNKRSVPQIFLNGNPIGGYEDLKALLG